MSCKRDRPLTPLHIRENPNYATPTMPESLRSKKRRLDRKRKAISHYLSKFSNTANNTKKQICEINRHQYQLHCDTANILRLNSHRKIGCYNVCDFHPEIV
ncbi:11482_t:CDS:2 [Cetraspora pellucida]|uniref:11482_t:CDS:1 n=1 Tax=Cetraspora pellucida TaxID=1433469 RepID=A0ACA9MFP0_9GLOM|nr:11482_t:CDS:2 [Cetraspora pellucida]